MEVKENRVEKMYFWIDFSVLVRISRREWKEIYYLKNIFIIIKN